MPFVNCSGARIYWRTDGHPELPALVLVNSLGADHAMWSPLLDALTASFHVIRLDNRGHGASDAPAGDYTLEQLGRDVLAVADAAGAARFAYCGVSLGGMIGMWLGANAPERAERLVLANTSAKVDPAGFAERIATIRAGGMAAVTEGVLERWFTPAYRARRTVYEATVRSTMLRLDPAGYIGCCAAIRDMEIASKLPGIKAPTLVVVGTVDPSTPPERGREIAAAIPGATLLELPAAHFSHAEQPERLLAAMVPFLSGR